MAIPITIPRLGWSMEEGVFVAWLKPDGASVRPGDPLFSLEADKATQDIESLDAGILRIAPDGPRPGQVVAVGTVIAFLVQPDEPAPFESLSPTPQPTSAAAAPVPAPVPAPPEPDSLRSPSARRTPAISPRARRVARELGVDWTTLQGSGRTGRIRERDVRAAGSAPAEGTASPVGPVRRRIAERMLQSSRATAPVTLTTSADATNLVNLRQQFRLVAEAGEPVPGYTDLVVKLAGVALQRHPALNACWSEGGIVAFASVHVGIAVDAEAGLFVPVVRDVQSLTLRALAARTRDLAQRARQGQLTAQEMQGGTFTVTNLGAFGIDAFTPLINTPQCAVLGVGRIAPRAVVKDGQIVAREEITLSLTFDHRLTDGAPAARFLQTLVALLENPAPWLIA